MLKINSFSITQLKCSWLYWDMAALQDFKVSLLSAHLCGDLVSVYRQRKVKKNNIASLVSFEL